MRNCLIATLLKASLLLFAAVLFSVNGLHAQMEISIGTGTTGNTTTGYPCPLQDDYEGSRAQYLYKASELTAAGMSAGVITAIKFNVLSVGSAGVIENYRVRIGQTAVSALSTSSWETVSATVFGPIDYQPVAGINTLTLSTPFTWNGTDNIIIEVCNGASNTTSATTNTDNPVVAWTTAIGFNGSHTYRANDLNNLCGTATTTNTGTATTRPNITFVWGLNTPCSGTPAGGTATSNVSSICNPAIQVNLAVTGGSVESGLTYQWQSSPDGSTWTDIPGAVSYNYSITGLWATTHFRRQVTCGGVSSYSLPVIVNVNAPSYASLPFTESFESDWIDKCATHDIPNNYWRNTPSTGNASWRRNDDGATASWTSLTSGGYTPASSDGSYSARLHTYSAPTGGISSFDLYVNCNTGVASKRLNFDYINTSGSDSLAILVSTDGGNSFTRLDSLKTRAAWQTKTIYFNSTSATTVIRFNGIGNSSTSTDIGIDNISLIDFVPCSDTPPAGTASSSLDTACLGVPFTLNVSGIPVEDGLTFQWQSSPDNISWANISTATTASYTTGQNAATYYRVIVSCANSGQATNSTSVFVYSPLQAYAALPYNEGFENDWINNCSTRSIPNSYWVNAPNTGNASWRRQDDGVASAGWTSNSGAYTPVSSEGNYSARFHSYHAPKGAEGLFDLHINANTSVDTKRLTFDYINTSGTDSLVILLSTDGGTSFKRLDSVRTSTFWNKKTIDFSSLSSRTVIRFQAVSDYGTTDFGLDNVAVGDFVPCSGVPVAGSAESNATNVCAGTSFTLSTTGTPALDGITYQWQSSADNAVWNDISGATSVTYSLNQTASTYYRLKVTCANSGQSATTTAVLVTIDAPVYATLPYSESFESTWNTNCGTRDVPNYSWKNTPSSGNPSWRRNDDGVAGAGWTSNSGAYSPAASDGSYSARFHSYNSQAGATGSLDLHINCNTAAAVKRLTFDYINTSGDDSVSIFISTDGGANFTRLDSVQNSSPWKTKVINFNSTSATTIIRFKATSDDGYSDFGLDKINISEIPECSGTPVTGNVSSSETNVCMGTSFTLNATGFPVVSGINFQWQASADSITWNDISGATDSLFTTTQSASTYYRIVATCSVSGQSSQSAGVRVISPLPVSGTFTIDKNSPAGSGNFQSFNEAYNYIKCGIGGPVVFNVTAGSGSYNEQLIMDPVPGASGINTVTFNGNGDTLRFSSTTSGQRAVIKLQDADHIIFDNLVIDARGGTYGYGVQLINNADSNIVRNCKIITDTTATSENFGGIIVSASHTDGNGTGNTLCDNNEFSNNTITGGYYGVTLVGSSTMAVQRNKVLNNTIQEWYNYGIYASYTYQALLEGNEIARPHRTTSPSTNYGLYVTGLNASLTFSKNRIHDVFADSTTTNDFHGIYFTSVDALPERENLVINNLIYNIKSKGAIYGISNTGSDNARYYHNTISLDDSSSTATEATRGFYQTTTAYGVDFRNNLITISRGGTGTKHGIYINSTATEYLSDNNNIYIAEDANNYVGYRVSNRKTLIDWQVATTQDTASVSTDPRYTSPATGDFKPTAPSMDDHGTQVGITTDILGVLRSDSLPDIGAYEYTVPDCVTPPVAGTAVASTTASVCPNTLIGLNLTGNSEGRTQKYVWESATTSAGPWTAVSDTLSSPEYRVNPVAPLYYRAAVICSGMTAYSTSLQVSINPAFPGGTYTIDSSVVTGGTNFQSFTDAYNAIKCGITGPVVFNVVAGSGPYNEQLIIDPVFGASAVNTITFNGNGNTLKFSSDDNVERAVIKLKGADHFIFDSLVIDATGGTYGYGVQLINNADSNIIRNCTIITDTTATTENFGGIVMNASHSDGNATGATFCDDNEFSANHIKGGAYGITMVGGSSSQLIQGNKAVNNTIESWYQYGVYVYGSDKSLVEGNDIKNPTRTTSAATNTGIYLNGFNSGARVSKNHIHAIFGNQPSTSNAFYGIYLNSTDAPEGLENFISNNIISDIKGNGLIYALYNAGSDNAWYYHNTISLDDASSASTDATRAFYQTTTAQGIQFRNNLVTIFRGGSGAKHGIYMGTAATTYASDHNNFYIQQRTGNYTGYNGADRISLAAWQTATGKDLNSVAVNPLYTSLSSDDLEPNSPVLDNKGTNVNISSDIRDMARSTTTPDIGAYEFAVPVCTTPPTPGTATANPSSGMCMATPVALSLSGITLDAGQTYQWEYATTSAGPYTALGNPMSLPDTTIEIDGSFYYRAAVRCNGGTTAYSTPVLVSMNPAFLGGTYTINNTIPTGGTNFNSFKEAVAAMDCGITAPVFFDVAPGTYTEQVLIHRIRGAANNRRVTFRSATGDPASVSLQYPVSSIDTNYVVRLDSASFITFNGITITATDAATVIVKGRAVEFANTAAYDSLLNCIINVPASNSTSDAIAGIYADDLQGSNNVIRGNTVNNGSFGIYLGGTSATNLTYSNVIDSNTLNGTYYYGIYAELAGRISVINNTIHRTAPLNATAYGIYASNIDTAYNISGNTVTINNTTNANYGILLSVCNASENERGRVANNKILALAGNTGEIYGLYQDGSTYNNTVNNVISVHSTSAKAYGIYSTGGGRNNYYNNTVLNTDTTSATTNVAAYFNHTSSTGGVVDIRNNIFSHEGGGRALYIANANYIYSDYNMLYSTGAILVQSGSPAGNHATLTSWNNAAYWDVNSIVIKPAFVSNTNLRPDVTKDSVWAMHGRGVQIPGNDLDIDNNPRPTTLAAGVPDLGAYEFVPTSVPPVLAVNPATPAPGTTQTFTFGSDTVTKITWAPGSTVPATIALRRYTGVTPPGLAPSTEQMYFYTDADVTGTGTFDYTIQQFYMDPWQGTISAQEAIKLGRTNSANAWLVDSLSTLDDFANVITKTNLDSMDKFTGLTDGRIAPPPPSVLVGSDSSNRGKNFWTGYAYSWDFEHGNNQRMVLYLSTDNQPARVTVRVNSTGWSRVYEIPANTAISTETMPQLGLFDSRLNGEGKFSTGISITSDVPITAYGHIYASTNSGATMLLPVGTYGYEYYTLNSRQNYSGPGSYSSFFVVADRDNTLVEITPSNPTLGGKAANTPFTVTLNKGEVYQVLGAIISGSEGYDLSGSKIRSIPNADGKCFPVGVFAGSSRTGLGCGSSAGGTGDLLFQQVFPSQAWGKRYLTAPTSTSGSASSSMTNMYRILVKDPATQVKRNNAILTGLINNRYYAFESNTADVIESDQPIMVAQYMSSSGSCSNTSGDGDPELFYLSPVEQAVNYSAFYRNNVYDINTNYLTIVIPDGGLSSLRIDGSSTFDHTYPHSQAGYTVVVKKWDNSAGQSIVKSDSAFTGIVYGLGSVESYGYNVGTLVKNLQAITSINNVYNTTGSSSEYTCTNAPFRFNVMLPFVPETLTWKLSDVDGLSPNTDKSETNPVPVDSIMHNGTRYYKFTINQNYTFGKQGTYNVPIVFTHPSIESCDKSREIAMVVKVNTSPVADFAVTFSGCTGDVAQFNGAGTTGGVTVNQWNWQLPGGATASGQQTTYTFNVADTFDVKLRVISADGCIGDTTKQVIANSRPVVNVSPDSLSVCPGTAVSFAVDNPDATVTYNWYTTATGGTAVNTGASYSLNNPSSSSIYYVEGTNAGCASAARDRVVLNVLPLVTTPVVTADTIGTDMIRFRWNAVANASSYEVTTNDGTTWIVPSSGASGLTHTITGLQPLQSVTLSVRAKGGCQDATSLPVTEKILPDGIFIPNTLMPNSSIPQNRTWRVFSYKIKEMTLMVFNQWGEKLFETTNLSQGWDGSYRGKLQPSGVYMYVCRMLLQDGTTVTKKGTINLIR